MQLGTVSILLGDLPQARAVLEGALGAERGGPQHWRRDLVPGRVCPASVRGGRPRAGGVAGGAAEGLRRRAGLRVWPTLRQSEDELVAQVRQMLGAERFDQAFSAGSRLTQREAIAIVRDQRRTGTQTP